MPNTSNQKGTIPLLLPIIIGSLVIGGIFIVTKKLNNPPKTESLIQQNPQTVSTPKSATNSAQPETAKNLQLEPGWTRYVDKQYGYHLNLPPGWTVENVAKEGGRKIQIIEGNNEAAIRIAAEKNPDLTMPGGLEKVLQELEAELRNTDNIQVEQFSSSTKDDYTGYIASGKKTESYGTNGFEERALLVNDGRTLMMHGSYLEGAAKHLITIQKIMSSFGVD